jgi:hypothetical protein
MEGAVTVLMVVGGLVFSVSCALLVEELVFGGLFRIFFQRKKEGKNWFVGGADRPVVVPIPVEVRRRRAK